MPGTPLRTTTGRAYRLGPVTFLAGWTFLLGWTFLVGWSVLLLARLGAPTVGAPASQAVESLAGAAVAAATALLLAAVVGRLPLSRGGAADRVRLGTALRQRARRCRTPRHIDPDAAGRPRPRAPSTHPSAG